MAVFGGHGEAISVALAELSEAREAPYYDEPADIRARDGYYAGLDRSVGPDEMYAALSGLAAQTHRTQLHYKPALQLYPSVDLQPNGQLRSIYTGEEFAPEAFIHDDAAVEQRRMEALRERLTVRAVVSDEERRSIVAQVEAELPYNCEHVVPQSWFDEREPMRGDLHHLFACEKPCNNFRAAIPYFDFSDFRDMVRERCGKAGERGFEPMEGKGAVARATLYFLVRYPGEVDLAGGEMQASRLEVLLRWHHEFEVTVYERHRNALIHAKQGNRNPFVDDPALASRVSLHLGLG